MTARVLRHPASDPAAHNARKLLRMADKLARLEAEAAQLRLDMRPVAAALCDARGIKVVLRGPALVREAEAVLREGGNG